MGVRGLIPDASTQAGLAIKTSCFGKAIPLALGIFFTLVNPSNLTGHGDFAQKSLIII